MIGVPCTLELTEFKVDKILEAINVRRTTLGLPPITVMTPTTSFSDGLTVVQVLGKPAIAKNQALFDLKSLEGTLREMSSAELSETIIEIIKKLESLRANATLLTGLVREQFLKSAIELVTDDLCPVCDTPWDNAELIEILREKLKEFDQASIARANIEIDLLPFVESLKTLGQSLSTIQDYGTILKINTIAIKENLVVVNNQRAKLLAVIPIDDAISTLNDYSKAPKAVLNTIVEITEAINNLPDPTHQDAAKIYLSLAQERLERYRAVSSKLKKAEDDAVLTSTVFDTYAKVTTDFLEKIYKEVENDFIEFYRYINSDDESAFTAELIPSIGKLGFHVDFYGRGYFPPGAYHSEGHQDGMGLCLYLALMKHLQGDSFTFAVLDDVLMSVDTGHRREVCNLLKDKFPNTQFILTTHDDVWLKHMKTAGLVPGGASMNFRKWNVELGPTEWSTKDLWDEIETEIVANNIQGAAGILRHYLEFIAAEACDRLRARVEYRGDGQYLLGDFLSSATSKFSQLLGDGEKAARGWSQTAEADSIKKRKEEFDQLVTSSNIEQWQINSSIHFNPWINLEEADFRPVALSYKKLTESLMCSNPDCGSLLYTIPAFGSKETLRCSCGSITINLKKK
ncbi:MAG: chromosome segregation protein SMC [Bacteriovoracaceae bacterium]